MFFASYRAFVTVDAETKTMAFVTDVTDIEYPHAYKKRDITRKAAPKTIPSPTFIVGSRNVQQPRPQEVHSLAPDDEYYKGYNPQDHKYVI